MFVPNSSSIYSKFKIHLISFDGSIHQLVNLRAATFLGQPFRWVETPMVFFFEKNQVLCSPECRNWRTPSPLQVRLEQEEGLVVGEPGWGNITSWGFPKMVGETPTISMGFPTKNDHFGVWNGGYPYFRKHRVRWVVFFWWIHPNWNWRFLEKQYIWQIWRCQCFHLLDKVHLFYIWVVWDIFLCSSPIWGRFPIWLIFFKGVGSTTN